jgi:hypothetical protein
MMMFHRVKWVQQKIWLQPQAILLLEMPTVAARRLHEQESEKHSDNRSQAGLPAENSIQSHQTNDSEARVVVILLSTDNDEPLPQQAAEVRAAGACQWQTCGGNLADGHPSAP